MIVAPYIRSVGHVFAHLYTLCDDSECPMDYDTSLLPNVFPEWDKLPITIINAPSMETSMIG